MTDKETFEEIKREILRRAHVAQACMEQYRRAYESETMAELCQVIKDNFWWACWHQVIDTALLKQYEPDFAENDIYVNVSVSKGYLLCDNATVEAYGNAMVGACGNATVRAYDNAAVRACDNATVRAYGNAYCSSFAKKQVTLSGNAIYRVESTNTVYYVNPNLKFVNQ